MNFNFYLFKKMEKQCLLLTKNLLIVILMLKILGRYIYRVVS